MAILLPATFKPTHLTAGLPGFPAIDVFGSPGAAVRLDVRGRVSRLSGHPCSAGGAPHGAYGRSVYVDTPDGSRRFLTHLDGVSVAVGQAITPSTVIGTLCDSAVSGLPGTTHVHYGLRQAPRPIPPPANPLYDVLGPRGNGIASRRTAGQVERNLERWIRQHRAVTIRRANG